MIFNNSVHSQNILQFATFNNNNLQIQNLITKYKQFELYYNQYISVHPIIYIKKNI